MARSTVVFVLLTTAPGVVVLAILGVALWLGLPGGPHGALLTLLPAALAAVLLALTWLIGRSSTPAAESQRRRSRPLAWLTGASRVLGDGAAGTRRLLAAGNWKLLGTLAYYAFDNAVLWAAFRAYGAAPPVGVIVMGYLVGSLGSALPVPGGLGAVEGGLIGALVLYGAPAAPAAGAVLLYRGISLGLAVSLSAGAWAIRHPGRAPRGNVARLRRESVLDRMTRRGGPRVHAELAVNGTQMRVHGATTNHELV
jgi:uncharacterized membrane protein YbhN (UPF0104 family)